MLELNKVLLVGRLTRDPEIRSTSTGKSVAQLSLAVNRRRGRDQEDETTFVDIETWERNADFCRNYLNKGSGVYIEGRLRQDRWQDRETGGNRSKIVVVAERIQFAETRAEAQQRTESDHSHGGESGGTPEWSGPSGGESDSEQTNDDLPF